MKNTGDILYYQCVGSQAAAAEKVTAAAGETAMGVNPAMQQLAVANPLTAQTLSPEALQSRCLDFQTGKLSPDEVLRYEPELDVAGGLRNIQDLKEQYVDDIIKHSEVPETINKDEIVSANFVKCSAEETAYKREMFGDMKDSLIKQWEEVHGQTWPTYSQDIYSSNGHLIRRCGDRYDAHHLQPLSQGGQNEVGNITPLHADCHYDRQGIHSPDSAYAKIEQEIGA